MKYCEIEIKKDRTSTSCLFVYPAGYDPRDHEILCYENHGLAVEFAVSNVPDNFDFSSAGYTELSEIQAHKKIDDFIDTDVDFNFNPMKFPDEESAKTHMKTLRKNMGKENAA